MATQQWLDLMELYGIKSLTLVLVFTRRRRRRFRRYPAARR